jgi:hypothetical protein
MPGAVGLQSYVPTITSILAITISSLTLGWTIYRDAIRQPKFKVDVGVKKIMQAGREPEGPLLSVEALNMGPIPNRIGLTFVRKNWMKRRFFDRDRGSAMVYPDYNHRVATPASTRLEVGDQANFIFPYTKDCFLKEDFSQIGVADGFGRIHLDVAARFPKNSQEISKGLREYVARMTE